jgi:hypothetical protein
MTEENKFSECPEWCTSGHVPGEFLSYHWGPRTGIYAEDDVTRNRVSVTPFHATGCSGLGPPEVNLCSAGVEVMHLGMTPRDARVIAEIIDTLSGQPQIGKREFAEGIRASAQSVEMDTGPRAAETGEPEAGA